MSLNLNSGIPQKIHTDAVCIFSDREKYTQVINVFMIFSGKTTNHGSVENPWQLNITLRKLCAVLVSRIFKPRSKPHDRLVLISLIPHGTYTLSLSTS